MQSMQGYFPFRIPYSREFRCNAGERFLLSLALLSLFIVRCDRKHRNQLANYDKGTTTNEHKQLKSTKLKQQIKQNVYKNRMM